MKESEHETSSVDRSGRGALRRGIGHAQDRSGGLIGSGTRSDSGQTVGSGGLTTTTQDQWMGNGGRSADSGQVFGSGYAASQVMGSGGRTEDAPQILGSGGLIGSGTRAEDDGQVIGSGYAISPNGGYLGSGLSAVALPLPDGSSVLVVSSDEALFVIPIGQ